MVHGDDEESKRNLNVNVPTPSSYRERLDETAMGMSIAEGTFVYDDDVSEMYIPPTPLARMRNQHYSPLEDDSAHDKASVGSSFMNYTYSNEYDDSTIGTGPKPAELSLAPDARSIGVSSTEAEIQERSRPEKLNVNEIMQSSYQIRTHKEAQQNKNTCVPGWIANASNSIKFVIVMATAMLLASLVLVSITATVSVSDASTEQHNVGEIRQDLTTASPTISTTMSPTMNPSKSPTMNPSASPTSSPTSSPSASPVKAFILIPSANIPATKLPSASPTVIPSHGPTMLPSPSPSIAKSSPPSEFTNVIQFASLSKKNSAENMKDNLKAFSSNGIEFIVHLGNWNVRDIDKCKPGAYNRTENIFRNSEVPVFFLPGANEWNRCPQEQLEVSHENWRNHFVDFESKHWMNNKFNVSRQNGPQIVRPENFAFEFKEVLFIGLNMVNKISKTDGQDDENIWNQRLEENLDWVKSNFDSHKNVNMVVIFGSAGNSDVNKPFFEGLRKEIKKRTSLNDEFRVMYVRQASLEMEGPKKDKEQNNLLVFHVERGHWPPTKFSIDTGDNYDLSFDDGKI